MKTLHSFKICLSLLLIFTSVNLFAQGDCTAQPDTLCIELGDPVTLNVLTNDGVSPDDVCGVQLETPNECMGIEENGMLFPLSTDPFCCGEYILHYNYILCEGTAPCASFLYLKITCPKPDCFLVNLEDYISAGDPVGGGMDVECAYACENSEATYYVNYNPTSTYVWNVTGGTYTTGSNAAEIIVTWGPMGTGSVSLTITDSNNQTSVIDICVDILEGPVADFAASDTSVCLNSPISFINNSTGGSSYFWDFGDGNTSTMFSPTHTFNTPGTYNVTLYATRDNYDADGNPLCCCTDSTSLEVFVDSLEGPNIYCISTLCAFDSSQYWTDATNCSSYIWTVLDANGLPVTFSGQGNDTISVQWGNGPYGTISLEVAGCDSAYCDEPVTVVVPIISNTVQINGPTVVCENSSATYTVPKWMSVYYDWQLTGGTVISGQGTNTVVIQWTTGTGTINLNYSSNFLGGLPGHEQEDCEGSAVLNVNILPEFDVSGPVPGIVCLNSNSNFFATSVPYANYTWTISPPVTFTGQGTSVMTATWDNGPGTFIVTATPNDTTVYCNDLVTKIINVIELPPPDSISGPDEICPGDTYTYFGHSSQTGTGFNWTVTGGTPSSFSGDPITVTWNPTGPYILSLQQFQFNAPFCTSDPIQKTITPKLIAGPLSISGSGTCVNEVGSYSLSPAQHPDAVITWNISPVAAGSVISGQGMEDVQVQWNNTPGPVILTATVSLCGVDQSVSTSLNLTALAPPLITQSGDLCPGLTATLDAGGGYSGYSWSTGATTQLISISSGGAYTVTVTDGNGCMATSSFNPVELAGPVASISTPDPNTLCIVPPNGNTVTISAQTNPNYNFTWYCKGIAQSLPLTQAQFVHTNTNVVDVFDYYVVVTDITTGCIDTSNTLFVYQTDMCDPVDGCSPANHSVSFVPMNQMPNCNIVDFPVNTTGPVTLLGWNFNDPNGNINSGTLPNAQHTYIEAGYYNAVLTYQVPEQAPGTGFCTLFVDESVCIPIAANFNWVDTCLDVCFNNLSTFLPLNDITTWFWDFGDFSTSGIENPCHTYTTPGTKTVTLTVTNVNGCQATITKTVIVGGVPLPTVNINPMPACVGDSIGFNGIGGGIISWLWDFGDGSNNGGQNPSHSYLNDSTYQVSLTVTDTDGCVNTITQTLLVNPLPPDDSISYSPSLTICEGETVTLTAPAGPYTYLWSTGATSPSIVTGTAGEYSVIVSDINGCVMEPPSVTVVVIPKPDAFISGPSFICDAGCITLNAPIGFSFAYQWLDNTGTPIPFQTFSSLTVCDFSLLPGYQVIVTNANNCSDTSAIHTVNLAVSPSFIVNVAPDSCEGSPVTLSVNPIQPNVTYSWSNGGNGTSITVSQAGTYTAVGTDTLTGCTGSASAVIHPLPDLCIVPAGCYEACDPDTICGPDGLAMYQWNLNGVPISGETGQCLIVTQSGTYTLTGTTSFGCSMTSDSLELMLIDCDTSLCDMVGVEALPLSEATDSCCWSINLTNAQPNYFTGISITALNGVSLGYNGSNAGWNLIGSSSSHVDLLPPSLGFIPTGSFSGDLFDVADFCLSNLDTTPQYVVVSWLIPGIPPLDFEVACTDTLIFDCQPEACVEIIDDSIYCQGDTIKYTFSVMNLNFTEFIQSLKLHIDPSLNINVSPNPLNFTPIPPLGTGGPFTVCITGPDAVFGDTLKFFISAHDSIYVDGIIPTFCCSDTADHFIPFPDCDPCEFTDIIAEKDSIDCCYNISLINNFSSSYFSGIQTQLLTTGATFGTISGAFPLGWIYTQNAPNDLSWKRIPLGSDLPLGITQLPKICLGGDYPDSVVLVVNWFTPGADGADSIACTDTLVLLCDPTPDPCVYLLEEFVICDPATGKYFLQFQFVNNSGYDIDELLFSNIIPSGVIIDSVPIILADGDTSSLLSTCISGPGAVAGAEICFRITLHDLLETGDFLNCCVSDSLFCIVLPPCENLCEEGFIKADFASMEPLSTIDIDILGNDFCPDGSSPDPATISIITPPQNGTIINIDPITGIVTYEHNTDLTGQDCFTYEVCCVDATGNLICCQAEVCIEVAPFPEPCSSTAVVTGVTATLNPSGVSATLNWNAMPGAAAYQIKGRPVGTTGYATLVKTNNFTNVGGLAPGTCYEWKIRAGCFPLPSVIGPFTPHDTFCTAPLRETLFDKFEAELIPNPVSTMAELRMISDLEDQAVITINDLSGRELLRFNADVVKGEHSRKLDLSSLEDGFYILEIRGSNVQKTIRFIAIE